MTKTRRYSADEYFQIKNRVIETLTTILPDSRIEDVKAYGQKPDFGDLDVVVENLNAKNRLEPALSALGIDEIVKNGPVWSLGWEDFQVDLIFQPSEDYEFACHYFAYNDLGNLIGRIARRLDLKFGHDGLSYTLRDGDYKIADIALTKDFDSALEYLGFSPERYKQGFETLNAIFEFVTTSPYFDHESFMLHNRSNKARVRDAKRPNYRAFLEYAANQASDKEPLRLSKEVSLEKAKTAFPEFAIELDKILALHARKKDMKCKFNGDVVSELTGLSGKELGSFMASLRKSHTDDSVAFTDWVMDTTDEQLSHWIQFYHERFQNEQKHSLSRYEP